MFNSSYVRVQELDQTYSIVERLFFVSVSSSSLSSSELSSSDSSEEEGGAFFLVREEDDEEEEEEEEVFLGALRLRPPWVVFLRLAGILFSWVFEKQKQKK